MSAAAAQSWLAQVLDADPAVTATVFAGSADSLRGAPLLVAEAVDVDSMPARDVVACEVTAWVPYSTPSAGDAALVALMDAAIAAVRGARTSTASGGPHWLGPSTGLTWRRGDATEREGRRVASAALDVSVAVPRSGRVRVGGATERAVRAVLDDGGVETVAESDEPPFVLVRWGGTDDEDPTRDVLEVWCATEIESGEIEALTTRVMGVLRASSSVVMIGGLSRDDAGQPPGSAAAYEVGLIEVTVGAESAD